MPPEIHRAAKRLVPTFSQVVGGRNRTSWGARLHATNPRLRADTRAALTTLKRPWHSTSIYSGMVKRVTRYPSGATSSVYQTFRTISSRTPEDPRSWYHGGITARNLAPKVQSQLSTLLSRAVWKAINSDDT
jgi:hypothetical protein